EVSQVATLTCEPNAKVAEIHDRMGVILTPKDIPLFLSGTPEEIAPLLVAPPDDDILIERAQDVDWTQG
ncbi:MAG: SOS response-associated peptidase family protein, partial [Pseudomonadota bacterium]